MISSSELSDDSGSNFTSLVRARVIIHCLDVSCKEDQITSVQRV